MYHLWFLSPKNHISKNLINCLMPFPVHLHTVSSLWSTMWSKIHSHMLCSLLTFRAITALLSQILSLQNWSWGYCAGCLAPGYSHSPGKRSLFTHIRTLRQKHRTNISSAVCTQQKNILGKSFLHAVGRRKWRSQTNINRLCWQSTLQYFPVLPVQY